MKALVTGANGFLGSYLVRLLAREGHEVTACVRRKDAFPDLDGVQVALADVRDEAALGEAIAGHDTVFHTAAVAGIWGSWRHFHGTNTIGTRNVLSACQRQGVRKLVFTSSPSVTFNGDHQLNVNETAPYPKKWLAHYPHSKALAEQSVLEANDPGGLMTCALRPHLIWGPGDHHLIPRLLDRAKANQLRRVGDGTNQVDNIYVENAAEAHLMAAKALEPGSPVGGRAYFISQDDPVNCWGWINELLELAGLPKVKRSISFYSAYRVGYALELTYEMFNLRSEPRMTRFLAAQLAKSHYFDITRAKRDFGYYPRVSQIEGMKRLASSWGREPG